MKIDAEDKKEKITNEAFFPFFKNNNDPRVTKVGRILRKLSLDELPQLINIIRGEMVFVGPRPVLAEEAPYISKWHFMTKPGLTGPTQIKRDKNITLQEYNQLDYEFVSNPKIFRRDLQIILKTLLVVFKGA